MKQNGHSMFSNGLRRVAIATVVSGTLVAPAVYANASNIVLVPPTAQPKSARQTGEAIKRPAVDTAKDRWERDYELGRAGAG
jgi:hypothetical protein